MKLSAWDIYFVMQLDAIGCTLLLLSLGCAAVAVIGLIQWYTGMDFAEIYERSSYPEGKDNYAKYTAKASGGKRTAKRFSVPAVALILMSALIPSSKTAAAMLVLPAIVNNESVQKEAGDLYRLAKQGLAELVKPEPTEKVEK